MEIPDYPTPESVAAARHQMWEERAAVEREIGRPISPEGRILPFPVKDERVTIGCPHEGCRFDTTVHVAYAARAIARHIVASHYPKKKLA